MIALLTAPVRYTSPAVTDFRLTFMPVLTVRTLRFQEAPVQVEFVHALEVMTKACLTIVVEEATFTFVLWKALIDVFPVHALVHMALLRPALFVLIARLTFFFRVAAVLFARICAFPFVTVSRLAFMV